VKFAILDDKVYIQITQISHLIRIATRPNFWHDTLIFRTAAGFGGVGIAKAHSRKRNYGPILWKIAEISREFEVFSARIAPSNYGPILFLEP